jgi:hypothetical protein
MLRFNKIHTRSCEYKWEPTEVLEVFYSIDWENGVAQVKDYTEEKRSAILRDLRSSIKKGFAIYKK